MTDNPTQIEVTVTENVAIVRFRRAECLLTSRNPGQDVGKDLFALVEKDLYSLIVIDFDHPDSLHESVRLR